MCMVKMHINFTYSACNLWVFDWFYKRNPVDTKNRRNSFIEIIWGKRPIKYVSLEMLCN